MPESGYIEESVGTQELQEIERGEITRRIIQEEVLGTRIRCVNPAAYFRGVPVIDRRIELQARIATLMRSFGHLAEQIPRPISFDGLPGADAARGPIAIHFDSAHELVRYAHGIVCVLEENRAVGIAIERRIVTRI